MPEETLDYAKIESRHSLTSLRTTASTEISTPSTEISTPSKLYISDNEELVDKSFELQNFSEETCDTVFPSIDAFLANSKHEEPCFSPKDTFKDVVS